MRRVATSLILPTFITSLIFTFAAVHTAAAQTRNCHQHHFGEFSDWSAPENIAIVNTSAVEQWPAIAPSDLSLYFATGRTGGFGLQDIWVTQRSSPTAAWGAPQHLGPNINTSARDNTPYVSPDGHWLFFGSNRAGGCGNNDLYVSFRTNTEDDFAWGPARNLGCQVNSTGEEVGPRLLVDDDAATTTLYFTSNRLGVFHIYASSLQSDGTFGAPVLVPELNSNLTPPSFGDGPVRIRNDGLEMILNWSTVINPFSDGDLWVSTRASLADTWSLPQKLGPMLNTSFAEATPSLSCDGTALYFASPSDRLVGSGALDLWVSKRTPLGTEGP